MSGLYDPDHYVLCPMPDRGGSRCGEPLLLDWSLTLSFDPTDLDEDKPIDHGDHHTSGWTVGCAGGHVLLTPGYAGCPCEGKPGEECEHDLDDYDWSDEFRTFRAHDMGRLRDILAFIKGADQ